MPEASPVVMFGTGGSGTRVVARIVERAGCFLGRRLNDSADSLDLTEFLDWRLDGYLARVRWAEEVLAGPGAVAGPEDPEEAAMAAEFREAIARHREGIPRPEGRWGWKNPRSIFLLPFLHRQYPDLVAIHVVRDGRDMAYSANQNQLQRHGHRILGEEERRRPEPVQSMLLWTRLNLAAARYGERHLGRNYLRVRFEDLCADPAAGVRGLFGFLGWAVDAEGREAAVAEVKSPPSLGRWRAKDPGEVRDLTRAGEEALRAFGYLLG